MTILLEAQAGAALGEQDDGGALSVSVAMATYNGERFLRQQLESIARQTIPPAELVVSDDQSTDSTLDILRAFADKAPFKVVISVNCERLGYRKNFMKATAACMSALIFFCDQDDIWKPNKVEVLAAPFCNDSTMMAYHNAELIDAAGECYGVFDNPGLENPWRNPYGLTIGFRRSLLRVNNLFFGSLDHNSPDNPLAHDQWIPLLAQTFGEIVFVPEVLVEYRQHGANLYGAPDRSGMQPRRPGMTSALLEKLDALLADRSGKYKGLEKASEVNAEILERISLDSSLPDAWRVRAEVQAKAFQELAQLYRYRSMIYEERSAWRRLGAFRKLAKSRVYTHTAFWSFGLKTSIKEFLLAMWMGQYVSKENKDTSTVDHTCRRVSSSS